MTQEDKGREGWPDGVVAQMEALVRRLSEDCKPGAHYVSQIEPMRAEARAIVALLEPVDPAKAYVDQVFRGISDGGPMSDEGVKWMMEEAFKAGSLAAGDGR